MIRLLLALALVLAHASPENPTDAEFEGLLALPYAAFDQNDAGGHRPIRNDVRAAQVLDAYYVQHERDLTPAQARVIHWHAGQRYARAELRAVALARFERSYAGESSAAARRWDAYVRGTIAFMHHDWDGLVHAATELRGPPSDPNAKFLTSFLRCFDKSYREAYDPGCRAPGGRVNSSTASKSGEPRAGLD